MIYLGGKLYYEVVFDVNEFCLVVICVGVCSMGWVGFFLFEGLWLVGVFVFVDYRRCMCVELLWFCFYEGWFVVLKSVVGDGCLLCGGCVIGCIELIVFSFEYYDWYIGM